MKPNRVPLALALVAALAVVGCGSSNKSSSSSSTSSTPAAPATTGTTSTSPSGGGGAGGNLKLSADPSGALKFDKSSLSAKSGKVTLTMDNPSAVPHGVSIEGNGVDEEGKVVNQGGTSTVTGTLKPGKYTFFCPVPGHRQAGMQGTLTVQ
jgi:uncharacterized cupredoxin-like copper-binding protein